MAMDINTLYAKADAAYEKQQAIQIQFGQFSSVVDMEKKKAFRAGYIVATIEAMQPKQKVTPWRA